MSGSLGSAYIDVVARTGQFRSKLAADLKAVLESSRTTTKLQMDDFDRLVASATAAGKRIIAAETEAYKIVEAASRAATNAQIAANKEALASWKASAAEMARAETEAYAIVAAEASRSVDAQIAAAARYQAAYDEAYAEVAAAARVSADAQEAAAARVADSQIAASRRARDALVKNSSESAAAQTEALKGLGKFASDTFGKIVTGAKFASIGVVGLGAALAGIGLVAASKQQAALVSFEALAGAIVNTKGATADLTKATNDLTVAQRQAISKDFLQRLITLANNSAISQTSLQDTSQALLALGLNGNESFGIIKDVGNALAASGKTGGGLNDDLKGVIVAFSQIHGAGRLLAQDLNQITTRIPSLSRTKVYQQLAVDLGLASSTAKVTAADLAVVRKQLKEGGVGSDVAIPALVKQLELVPGAALDAKTGLDALGRQNTTLAGRFESLKDNIRNALAQAFLPIEGSVTDSPIQHLADQVGAVIPKITESIAKIAPALQNFVSSFVGTLIKVLPKLTALIGGTFLLLGKGLASLNSAADGLSAKFKAFGDVLSRVGFGPALADALKAIASTIPPLVTAIGGIVVGLTPVLSIVTSVSRIFLEVLIPAVQDAGLLFGGLGIILAPVADVFKKIADAVDKAFGSEVGKKIQAVIDPALGLAVALTAVAVASALVEKSMIRISTKIVPILVRAFDLAAIAAARLATSEALLFLLNPIVLGVAAIAALGVAFYEAWQNSELFRQVVVDIGRVLLLLPLAPLLIGLKALSAVFEFIAGNKTIISVLEFVGKVITGIVLAVGTITLVIPAIVAVIAVIREVVEHFGDIISTIQDAAGLTGAVLGVIGGAIATAFSKVVGFFKAVGEVTAEIVGAIVGVVVKIATKIGDVIAFIGGVIGDIFSPIAGFIADVVGKLGFFATAFDAIKGAAGDVGGFLGHMFDDFLKAIDFVAGKIKALFEALSKAAGFGGKLNPFHGLADDFDKAAHAMDGVTGAAIGATNKIGDVALGLHSVDGTSVTATIKIQTIIGPSSTDAGGFTLTNAGDHPSNLSAADRAKLAADKAAADAEQAQQDLVDELKKSLAGIGGGGGGAGGGASGGGSAAKNAAAQVKTTFLQAIKDILAGLDSDFKKSLVTGTRKQIDSTLDALSKKIADVFKAGKQKRPSALLDDIAADNVKLKNKADERDDIAKKLKKATDRFNEVKSAIKDFASVSSIDLDAIGLSAKAATDKLVDLSRLRIVLPGQDTLNVLTGGTAGVAALKAGSVKFAAALADKLKAIQDFQVNIQKLIKANLNKTTIDQIISAGPEGGGTLAASLAGASAATISSINTSQTAIDAAATTLANTAADSLFRTGKSVVDGLIAGLKEKRDEIKAAMKQIADDLVAEIKKALKAHSPSQVMHGIGRDVGAGLHLGMASKAADITAAARDMAAAAVPPNLVQMGHADAASRLSALGLPTTSRGAMSTSTATHSKTYNTPITVHQHGPAADPLAAAKHLARIVGGLR